MLFQLMGRKDYTESELGGYGGKRKWFDVPIAFFSSRKKALLYIEDSKLRNTPVWRDMEFKKKSLLYGYMFARVEPVGSPPYNPQI